MTPSISVVISHYNGHKYLEAQIQSILNQSVRVSELIIVDDFSTCHKSLGLLSKISQRVKDLNLVIIKNSKNLGPIKSFLKGIERTSGDLILLSDQDDIWNNHKVEKFNHEYVKCETQNPILIFSDLELIDFKGRPLKQSFFSTHKFEIKNLAYTSFFKNNYIPGCCMGFNKALKSHIQKLSPSKLLMHDHAISLIAYSIAKTIYIEESLIQYRIHDDSITAKNYQSLTNKILKPDWILEKIKPTYFTNYLLKEIRQVKEIQKKIKDELPAEKIKKYERFTKLEGKCYLVKKYGN